jgi:hypothetical protein
MVGKQRFLSFMGVVWGNYKPHFLQTVKRAHVVGQSQMPNVNGVKRPKKQTDHAAKKKPPPMEVAECFTIFVL